MKVAIVGSRDYPHERSVRRFVRGLAQETVVISGGARGVDTWAEQEAVAIGISTNVILADWETLGKSAGIKRNYAIVDAADVVVAFWDGHSRGTAHTIEYARKQHKLLAVFGV